MVVIKLQTKCISLVSIIMMLLLSCQYAESANMTTDKVLSYYSVEYHESRNKFLKAANALKHGDKGDALASRFPGEGSQPKL